MALAGGKPFRDYTLGADVTGSPKNGSCDVDCLHCGARHTTSAKVLPAYLQMRLEYGESRRSSSERPVALKQAERAGKTDRG